MGPIWGRQDADGHHVGLMNFAIWIILRGVSGLVFGCPCGAWCHDQPLALACWSMCSQIYSNKQRVLMHGHQGWNVRHGLCHIYMIYVYIWVVYSFCLFCCLFIFVTTQFVALYKPCKPKPKPSTYDPPPPPDNHPRTTTPWQRSKFRYLDRSQSNKYAINMQIQTISVSK